MKDILSYYSLFYVGVILCFTIIFQSFHGWMLIVYAVMAIPFLKNPTAYICICLTLSTTAYYYAGCDEQIYSIYSILVLLSLISHRKNCFSPTTQKRLVPFLILSVIAAISFFYSPFYYYNGLYELLYIIFIAIIIITFVDIKYEYIYDLMPKLSFVMIIFILFKMSMGSIDINGRFCIDRSVDANTSGAACALFATANTIPLFIKRSKHKIIYFIGSLLSVTALFLTGSRSALTGYVCSCIIIYCLISYRQRRMAQKIFILSISLVFLIVLCVPILEQYIDLSRFLDVDSVVRTGGTHRTQIFSLIIQYTFDHNLFWGYGPGHVCSSDVVSMLMNRKLAHTHNIFVEAFGEMGLMGLVALVAIVFFSLKTVLHRSKFDVYAYTPLALFLCIIINGQGESFLCDIVFWIIIALCIGNTYYKKKVLARNGKFN